MDRKSKFPIGSRVELKRDYFVHNPHGFIYTNVPDRIFGEIIDNSLFPSIVVKLDTPFGCANATKPSHKSIDEYWAPDDIITLLSTPHTPPPTKIDYLKINQECSNL